MGVEPRREPPEVPLLVTSLLSHRTHQGIVSLKIGEHETQMPPAKARQVATFLLEAAEAADYDGLVFAFFRGLDMDEAESARAVLQFRGLRDAKRKKEERDAAT